MADHLKLQLSLQDSSVPDIPKTGIEQSLQGSRVLDIPKTETKDFFPVPLASLERPDLRQEPSPPESPEGPDLWREQRWKDILSKEERRQQCPRCKEIGHGLHHCPYPVCMLVTEGGNTQPMVCHPKGKYRCGRCGRRGHNRRTCHGPVSY
ncbi:hypothetical protein GQ457_06G032230 [Hibiscus cannabinus]